VAKKEDIVSYSAEELAALPSESDWAAAMAMSQDQMDRLADEEDGPLPEGWEKTIVLGVSEPKKDVHIRLDSAVLRWFKAQGPGYQTRINEVLRGFVPARQRDGKAGV
jgi:uncharacterized protein (DUF4415 family)